MRRIDFPVRLPDRPQSGEGSVTWCDVFVCEAPASHKAPVSANRAFDGTRNFCEGCLEAYYIGVQHGTMRTLAEMQAKRRRKPSKRKSSA